MILSSEGDWATRRTFPTARVFSTLLEYYQDWTLPTPYAAHVSAHTSVAIHDALKMLDCPVIELHLSNVHAREPWRQHSYVSLVATAMIAGFGSLGYELAVDAVLQMTRRAN